MHPRCPVCRKRFVPTRADAVTCSGRCRVVRHRWLQELTPPWPEGIFDLAVVDVPLRFVGWSPKGEGRSPQRHYPTMDPAALISLLRPMFATILAPRASVCWWVYGPRLPVTLHVLEASGLIYSSELFVWKKLKKDGEPRRGMGMTTRKFCQNAWLAKRGDGLKFRAHPDQLIEAVLRENSRKPDESYHRLEQAYGEVRRLDLFSRYERPGWTSWGNQMIGALPLHRAAKVVIL
jgi:N6-adenosine-specific RNA methylase IME4